MKLEAITAALTDKHLAGGVMAARNICGDVYRCAVGELAHVAGVPDHVLLTACSASHRAPDALAETYAAVRATYALTQSELHDIIAVSDAALAGNRAAAVVAHLVHASQVPA